METIMVILLFLLGFIIYFLPSLVGRKKKNCWAIFALNFFLGWTIVGWVVALVWAATKEESVEVGNLKKCPKCAEEIKKEAKVCRFCGFDYLQALSELDK